MGHRIVVAAMLLGGTVAPILAQSGHSGGSDQLRVGERVRLTSSDARTPPLVGTLSEVRGDTFFVARGSGEVTTIAVAASRLAHVERSIGQRRRTVQGALLGVLAGGAVGLVVGAAAYEPPPPLPCVPEAFFCFDLDLGRGPVMAVGALAGAAIGLVVGGLVGSGQTTDRWQRVGSSTGPLDVRVDKSGAGARAGLSFAFGGASRR